jgi:hypothetical protein
MVCLYLFYRLFLGSLVIIVFAREETSEFAFEFAFDESEDQVPVIPRLHELFDKPVILQKLKKLPLPFRVIETADLVTYFYKG